MPLSHSDALDATWTALKAQRGETLTYRSGSSEASLTGVLTRPAPAQVDGEGNVVFESRAWDVLIDPAWPDDAPAAFTSDYEPLIGDEIERDDGTIYKVQPSDVADACWRWSDGSHTFRRVFVEEL